jgi:hypothetical protein
MASAFYVYAYQLVDLMFANDRRHAAMQALHFLLGAPPQSEFGTRPKIMQVNGSHRYVWNEALTLRKYRVQ